MTKILMFLVFIFISCENELEQENSCIAPTILQGKWIFIEFAKADHINIDEKKPQHPFETFIQFDTTNGQRMEGRMAVNLISGNYKYFDRINDFRGNDLQFLQLGGTKIAVTEAQGRFEQQFFNQMLLVNNYEITKECTLLLFDKKPNINETMIFRK